MQTNAPYTNSNPDDCGFAGTLKNIQLNDLIQMCCLSAASLCMRVTKGDRQGTIFIVDGEIIHAACESIVGEEAFYRILGWQTGSFESIEMTTAPHRSIGKPYHFLIMEAARRVDEGAHADSVASDEDDSVPMAVEDDDRLRVLIVDDSPMMRKILSSMLTTTSKVHVVGMAANGREAIRLIDDLKPDLVTLDVNMPVMDGTSTLKHIMIKRPCPVLIMSNPGDGSSRTIFNFLELGAVDFMCKPTKSQDILLQQKNIIARIQMAATARVGTFRITRLPAPSKPPTVAGGPCRRLVIVLSGAGGHAEQMRLLAGLVPALAGRQGAVVAFHELPPAFSASFADYLSERCGFPAAAVEGQRPIDGGCCYVGATGLGVTVKRVGGRPFIDAAASTGEKVSRLDGFLASAAGVFGRRLVVVLLSGVNTQTGLLDGLAAVRTAAGRVVMLDRQSGMVTGPLERVAEAGLADAEVKPGDLVDTIARECE